MQVGMDENGKYDAVLGGSERDYREDQILKDKDAMGLDSNCDYFMEFLDVLKQRRKVGSSDDPRDKVSLLIGQMKEFMVEESNRSNIERKDDWTKENWEKFGVKPKSVAKVNKEIETEGRRDGRNMSRN